MACAALLAVSCGGDKKAEIKQMSGFVDGGTSMHVLVVDPIGGDAAQQSFALDDATDLKEAYGLLEGNVVMVDYKAAGSNCESAARRSRSTWRRCRMPRGSCRASPAN